MEEADCSSTFSSCLFVLFSTKDLRLIKLDGFLWFRGTGLWCGSCVVCSEEVEGLSRRSDEGRSEPGFLSLKRG